MQALTHAVQRYWKRMLSHVIALAIGFAAGIYVLPILTAQAGASLNQVRAVSQAADYRGTFRKDIAGSNAVHWAQGSLSIQGNTLAFEGEVAPGPDYRIYLVPEYVDTKEGFERIRAQAVMVSDLKTFGNFVKTLPADVDPSKYAAVVIWCERFSQFISAAAYRA